jgi:hypothetical protein
LEVFLKVGIESLLTKSNTRLNTLVYYIEPVEPHQTWGQLHPSANAK